MINRIRSLQSINPRTLWLIIFVVHIVLALTLKHGAGVSISIDPDRPWDYFWQDLKTEDLRNNLVESLWYLHAQPPLHNLMGGILANLFYPNQAEVQHYLQIFLGGLIAGMCFTIAHTIIGHKWVAFAIALFIAINPSLFLYEGYLLYTILSTFWVTASVFFVARFQSTRRVYNLYLLILTANAAALTRTVYHPIFLIPVIVFACVIAHTQWRRVLSVGILISLLTGGWLAKNYVQFGFFGTSSWNGMAMWKMVSTSYTPGELRALAEQGVISQMAGNVRYFSRPRVYEPYGFTETSEIPVLSRNDYNNINYVAIPNAYNADTIALLRYDPGIVPHKLAYTYNVFSCPSNAFQHIRMNRELIQPMVDLYNAIVYGLTPEQASAYPQIYPPFGSSCTSQYFILPASLIIYAGSLLVAIFQRRFQVIKDDITLLFTVFMVCYTTIVVTVAEISENHRHKFLVEAFIWIVAFTVVYRGVRYIVHRLTLSNKSTPIPA